MNDRRPDPDALLAHVGSNDPSSRRGRLKVFFGAVAGVGKTYAMLQAARRLQAEGRDVVVGVVETHGRKETEAQIAGLEVLPRREMVHRGVTLHEFDLAAALARKPALILMDELAHTNAPGSVHAKRWKDVEELRDAGIDVFATLNVQHVESLNDVVARITHVRVSETVPNAVLEGADEVELIDLPPGELLRRLDEGKVYVPEQAGRARERFFRRGNLIALRQLALRFTAEHVDDAMSVYRRAHAVEETWPVRERLLVGVGPAPSSRRLIRAAKRMADRLDAEWMAVFVETPAYAALPEADRQRVWDTLRLAAELGAETTSITGSGASALLEYARKHNVSKILVGKPSRARWRDRLGGSRLDEVVRGSGDIDVYVISGDADDTSAPRRVESADRDTRPREALLATGGVALITLLAIVLRDRVALENLIMLYLLGIVAASARLGRGPSILASVLSVAAFDWFCVPPYGTFDVTDAQKFPVFGVMLVVGVVISTLTARLKRQAHASRLREQRTAALFAITRELVALDEPAAIEAVTIRHVEETFGVSARIIAPDPFGEPRDRRGGAAGRAEDAGVARWVLEHGQPAGPGTGTLQDAGALYLPVAVGSGAPLAVLEVRGDVELVFRDPERMQLAETLASQAAAALERARLATEGRRAEQLVELNRLTTQFADVAARELHTPLAHLGAAVRRLRTLQLVTAELDAEQVHETLADAERLVRTLEGLVDDLLDLSRLERREFEIAPSLNAPGALVDDALAEVRASGAAHGVQIGTDLSPDLPPVRSDAPLIMRALRALVENAVRSAGPEGRVIVSADALPGFVQFSVADDGPGVPLAEQARIFEPFIETSDGSPHIGLGLAVTRGIVRAHGGETWVDSGPGPGAVFSFTLPVANA